MDRSIVFANWVSAEARALAAAQLAEPAPPSDLEGQRAFYDAFNHRNLALAIEAFPVEIADEIVADIPVHIVTPKGGASDPRSLICLHGGAFMWGTGAGALLEAVPVVATTGMRVIAIDYRLAPEHVFPAAVDDVLAVYDALLETSSAESIGIYGCSAGGMLTAQTVSRLIFEQRPLPGAVAMFHGTGLEMDGDTARAAFLFDPRVEPDAMPPLAEWPYFQGADLADPLVLPGHHPAVLERFPSSLLVTASRDFAASSCAVMHRRLLAAGVDAAFVMFDGVGHAHHMAVDLPESRETFALMARFFRERLR